MIDLEKPVRRKINIKNRDWVVSFNKLGIVFREKGSRSSGVMIEWNKVLSTAYGLTNTNAVKCSKKGTLTARRGAV